jgi:hypothetical protein
VASQTEEKILHEFLESQICSWRLKKWAAEEEWRAKHKGYSQKYKYQSCRMKKYSELMYNTQTLVNILHCI